MGYARRLLMSHPFLDLIPDQTLLAAGADSGAAHQQAARGRDRGYALVYSPLGRPIAVAMDALRGPTVRAAWFDPRTGTTTAIGTFRAKGARTFDPPGEPHRGNDWVLVLDAVRRRRTP